MKITPHFSLAEMTVTSTGIKNDVPPEHMGNLLATCIGFEQVRSILGNVPIIITSAYRNKRVNAAVGGVANSDHALAFAGDFRTPAMSCRRAAEILAASPLVFDQLILERNDSIIHLSFNPRLRRQVLRQPGGPGSKFYHGLG